VRRSNEAARRAGLDARVRFVRQDLYAADISRATVLTLYLLPGSVQELSAKLERELRPGTRVVAHDYGLAGWTPLATRSFEHEDKLRISGTCATRLYLYVVPPHAKENRHAA